MQIQKSMVTDSIKNILIVDDADTRLFIGDTLNKVQQFCVITAKDVSEALKLIDQSPGTIDTLLLSIVKPRWNDLEPLDAIQTRHSSIGIVIMAECPDEYMINHGKLGGNMRYLKKPFTPEILTQAILKEHKA